MTNMMRVAVAAMLTMTLAGCGSATGRIAPSVLGVSARDAFIEARSVARVWSPDARLRWVEGEGISPEGIALPGGGVWQFHYTAPDKTQQLTVHVLPLESSSEERPSTSPPGIIIGDNDLGTDWVDSRVAMDAVASASERPAAPASMLLVPTRPEQWIVRAADTGERWHVHAGTGEVLDR